jgi:hypothetical protein
VRCRKRSQQGEEAMSFFANKIAVAGLSFGLPMAIALADGPPKLDVSTSCSAAARGAISAGRDKASCLADEHAAEVTLMDSWSKYSATDKSQCIGNVKTGGPASYVELLSCLEVMRDAKEIREADELAPAQTPARPQTKGRPRY